MSDELDSLVGSFGLGPDGEGWLERVARAEDRRAVTRLAGYEVLAEVGRGGQGVVYRALQPGTRRQVALKRPVAGALDDESRQRFEREVRTAASLSHPALVTVYGIEGDDSGPVCVLEWVEGKSITEWSRGRSTREVVRLMHEVCAGVAHAHERGVVHRDLKPDNVLVGQDDEPRVLDFGLAKPLRDTPALTASAQFLGTLAYAAPETLVEGTRSATEAADVYSLGVLLFETLTGELPCAPSEGLAETTRRVLEHDALPPSRLRPEVEHGLDAVVLTALAKDPRRRYPDAGALAADLLRLLEGRPVLASPPGRWSRVARIARRRRVPLSLAALLALVLIVLGRELQRQDVALAGAKGEIGAALEWIAGANPSQALPARLVPVVERWVGEERGERAALAWLALGNTRARGGDAEAASIAFERALDEAVETSTHSFAKSGQGLLALARGDLTAAERAARSAADLNIRDRGLDAAAARGQHLLARVLLERGRLVEATRAASVAVLRGGGSRQGEIAQAQLIEARLLLAVDEIDEAYSSFESSIYLAERFLAADGPFEAARFALALESTFAALTLLWSDEEIEPRVGQLLELADDVAAAPWLLALADFAEQVYARDLALRFARHVHGLTAEAYGAEHRWTLIAEARVARLADPLAADGLLAELDRVGAEAAAARLVGERSAARRKAGDRAGGLRDKGLERERWIALGGEDSFQAIDCSLRYARLQRRDGHPERSLEVLERQVALLMDAKDPVLRRLRGKTYMAMGDAHRAAGRPNEARACYEFVLEVRQIDRAFHASAALSAGELALEAGDVEHARSLAERAREDARDLPFDGHSERRAALLAAVAPD